jgi:prepilin-type N-terminal cleavage/methylation domain-containing protein
VSDQRGFSTLEVLVALVLLGGILLGGIGLAWQQRVSARRLAAHRAAEAMLENTYERLLAGQLPLVSGPVGEGLPGLSLELVGIERPGTVRVVLLYSYRVDDTPFRRHLTALLRSP